MPPAAYWTWPAGDEPTHRKSFGPYLRISHDMNSHVTSQGDHDED